MRISDWSSDVCSSDLRREHLEVPEPGEQGHEQGHDHDAEHAEAQAGGLHPLAHRRPRIEGWSMRSGAAFSIHRATNSAGKASTVFSTAVTATMRGRFGTRNCWPTSWPSITRNTMPRAEARR